MSLLKEMRQHVYAHNKYLTEKYLENVSVVTLLRNTHPLYRLSYALQCKYQGLITDKEYKTIRVKNP